MTALPRCTYYRVTLTPTLHLIPRYTYHRITLTTALHLLPRCTYYRVTLSPALHVLPRYTYSHVTRTPTLHLLLSTHCSLLPATCSCFTVYTAQVSLSLLTILLTILLTTYYCAGLPLPQEAACYSPHLHYRYKVASSK